MTLKLVRFWFNEQGDAAFRTREEFHKNTTGTDADFHVSFASREELYEWKEREFDSLLVLFNGQLVPMTDRLRDCATYKYCDQAELTEIVLHLL